MATLNKNGRAVHRLREAFGHLKAIGATGEAVKLINTALALDQVQVSSSNEASESYGVVTLGAVEKGAISEAVDLTIGGKGFVEKFFSTPSRSTGTGPGRRWLEYHSCLLIKS